MLNDYGNPSSTYTKGREGKKLLDRARKSVAGALGCEATELVFTSCGSESDNWALLSGADAMARRGRHVLTSLVEHDAIRKSAEELERRGYEVTYLKPDRTGIIEPDALREALRPDTILVSLMLVNNETGAVTDIAAVSRVLKEAGSEALLHTDAVQAFCKLDFSPRSLGADLISVSGHKIHAPKGVGALYIRKGLRLKPYILGGAQEDGRRAGTEAVPQIAAFGEAAQLAKAGLKEKELAERFGLSVSEYRKCRSSMLKQRWQTQLEICKRMKERSMSQREMAELIGVSQSTIRSWLNAG
jgi:cysteine desulfurase